MNNLTLRFMTVLSLTVFLLSACGAVTKDTVSNIEQDRPKQATDITDVTTTGYLQHIDINTREISLDISAWVNRGKTTAEDIMHIQEITYDANTLFQDEQGTVVHPEDFKRGEKLALLPSADNSSSSEKKALVAEKVVLLTMSKEEKLKGFLAGSDNLHTVVIYEEGKTPPYDEMDFEKHVPESFSGGISWVPYIEGLAVDYKKELGLEKLPMILVFDRNDLIFQTETIEELKTCLADS